VRGRGSQKNMEAMLSFLSARLQVVMNILFLGGSNSFPFIKVQVTWFDTQRKICSNKTFPGNCFNQVAIAVKSLGSPSKGVYTLSRPSSSGVEIPNSFKVGLSSWMT